MESSDKYITIKCIQIQQPIGVFYIGAIDWRHLKVIAHADIRRIEKGEGKHIESYLGMQRSLSSRRVSEIGEYVKNLDATFPTSIILHIPSYTQLSDEEEKRNLIFDSTGSEMQIRLSDDIASILDGQHRIEGLMDGFDQGAGVFKHENEDSFQLNVTIFVDLDMDNQSMIFATVNKAQTKVNRSLVYDLFSFANTRSPQRTVHNIVRLLNTSDGSPFKDRIKILGRADDPDRETIAQATLAESIIKYISANPLKDRDTLKRGKNLKKSDIPELEKFIFRNLFIEDKDESILRIIWNLFTAVREKWQGAWEVQTLLSKSTGVIAIMRFLRPAYLKLIKEKNVPIGYIPSKGEFDLILDKVQIADNAFTKENYVPGTSGQSKLYHQLITQGGIE